MSFLDAVVAAWWPWVLSATVRAALLGALALAVDRMLPARTGHPLRAGLWTAVLLVAAVPPEWAPVRPIDALAFAAAVPAVTPSMLGRIAILVWAAVACAAVATIALRHRALRRRLSADARSDARCRRAARRAAQRLGLASTPMTVVSDTDHGAYVLGCRRPLIVLPAELATSSTPERLEHVLLHELAHVKRRDPLRAVACATAASLLWFHPAFWLATRRLRTLRELGADREVARVLGGETSGYRRTLVELSPWATGPSLAPGLVGHSELAARLEALERLHRAGAVPASATAGAVAVLALFCCAPVARHVASEPTFSVPALDQLEGCMQVRFAVLHALAAEQAR